MLGKPYLTHVAVGKHGLLRPHLRCLGFPFFFTRIPGSIVISRGGKSTTRIVYCSQRNQRVCFMLHISLSHAMLSSVLIALQEDPLNRVLWPKKKRNLIGISRSQVQLIVRNESVSCGYDSLSHCLQLELGFIRDSLSGPLPGIFCIGCMVILPGTNDYVCRTVQ